MSTKLLQNTARNIGWYNRKIIESLRKGEKKVKYAPRI